MFRVWTEEQSKHCTHVSTDILYRFWISRAWQKKQIQTQYNKWRTYSWKDKEYSKLKTNQMFVVHLVVQEVQDGEEHLISIMLRTNCKTC